MYVKYSDYILLGYSIVPENEFPRFQAMAEQIIRRHTSNRITDDNITEMNKRGVCEIIDEYYIDKNPQVDNENKVLASFTNEGYNEVYVPRKQASADTIKTTKEAVVELIYDFFTAEQWYRGV